MKKHISRFITEGMWSWYDIGETSSEFSLEIRKIPNNAAIGPYRYTDEFAWKVKWYKFNRSENKLFNLVPVSLTIRPS